MAIIVDNIAPLSGDPAADIATLHEYVQYLAESINRAEDTKKHEAAVAKQLRMGVRTNEEKT